MLDVGNGREELEVLGRVQRVDAVAVALVLPQCAHAGEKWVDLFQSPCIVGNVDGQRRVFGEHERAVELLLAD